MDNELQSLKAVMNAIPGYVSWVSEDLVYLGVNEGLASAYFLKPEDFVGKKLGFMGSGDQFTVYLKQFFESHRTHENQILKIKFAKNKEEAWYSLSITKYDNGHKAVVVGIDVSELKKAQQIIKDQQLQIASSSKLSALGEMAASVTHELSSPLTVIVGFMDYLKKLISTEPMPREKVNSILDKMDSAANHATVTIDGFRRYSRDGSQDSFSAMPIRSIVKDTLILCTEKFKIKGVKLDVPEYIGDLNVWCRSNQICQVLINILNNALDAIEEHQQREEDDKWVKLEIEEGEGVCRIFVSDSGPGIPPDIREKILQPFFTTKPSGKGTGIGLAISRKIMDEHRGKFYLKDTKETCFVLELPTEKPQAKSA